MTPQYIEINSRGSKFYYKDKAMKIFHREDGPAYEGYDGSKEWRIDGKLHREDGPAINGKLHREDGPAIEWSYGDKTWALNGERLSEQEFLKRTAKETILTMDEIAAKFGVDVSKLKIQK